MEDLPSFYIIASDSIMRRVWTHFRTRELYPNFSWKDVTVERCFFLSTLENDFLFKINILVNDDVVYSSEK